jgi:transcriptional regulator with XRE-family HTH domain
MEPHDEPIAAAFAAKLKELRDRAGLTMAGLGARCDPPILAPAIARYETGARLPSWGVVVRLAVALGKSTDEFRPAVTRAKPKGRGEGTPTGKPEDPEPTKRGRGKKAAGG